MTACFRLNSRVAPNLVIRAPSIRYSACGRDPDASFPSTLQNERIFVDTLWFSQVIYMLRGGCLDRAACHIASVTHPLAHCPSSGVVPASQTLYHSNWNRRITSEVRHPRDTLTARRLRECLMVFTRCSQGYSCLPYKDIMHRLTVNRDLAISWRLQASCFLPRTATGRCLGGN